jgi:hypothetical protein
MPNFKIKIIKTQKFQIHLQLDAATFNMYKNTKMYVIVEFYVWDSDEILSAKYDVKIVLHLLIIIQIIVYDRLWRSS